MKSLFPAACINSTIDLRTSLHRAFILLAEAEKKHADLLRKKYIASDSSINDNLPITEPASLFSGKADYMRDAAVVPGQLEVYATTKIFINLKRIQSCYP